MAKTFHNLTTADNNHYKPPIDFGGVVTTNHSASGVWTAEHTFTPAVSKLTQDMEPTAPRRK